MKKHIDIVVSGKVQGVFFRVSAKTKADELGIVGYAENKPDGTVYIEAEGEEDVLEEFSEWCRSGPTHAQVTDVTLRDSHEFKNFTGFIVK